MKISDMDSGSGYFQVGQRVEMNVLAVLIDEKTGEKRHIPGCNIVTVVGNKYYATQPCSNSASTFAPLGIALGTGSAATSNTDSVLLSTIAAGFSAFTAGYPKTSDADADNTGAGSNIVTWAVTFAAAGISQVGIRELCIASANSNIAGLILNRALFAAAFDKTTSDTLKVFVNHQFLGT